MDKDDLKSFYIAVLLSAIIVFGVNYMFPKPKAHETVTETANVEVAAVDGQTADSAQTDAASEENAPVYADLKDTLAQDTRLPIKNEKISGSIRLKGARFDEILLTKYKQTIEDNSPAVELFAPAKTEGAFFAQYGWLSSDKSLILPDSDTLWRGEGNATLTDKTPVTLVWYNGQGLKFSYTITLDENYLFHVTQTVENHTAHNYAVVKHRSVVCFGCGAAKAHYSGSAET